MDDYQSSISNIMLGWSQWSWSKLPTRSFNISCRTGSKNRLDLSGLKIVFDRIRVQLHLKVGNFQLINQFLLIYKFLLANCCFDKASANSKTNRLRLLNDCWAVTFLLVCLKALRWRDCLTIWQLLHQIYYLLTGRFRLNSEKLLKTPFEILR